MNEQQQRHKTLSVRVSEPLLEAVEASYFEEWQNQQTGITCGHLTCVCVPDWQDTPCRSFDECFISYVEEEIGTLFQQIAEKHEADKKALEARLSKRAEKVAS